MRPCRTFFYIILSFDRHSPPAFSYTNSSKMLPDSALLEELRTYSKTFHGPLPYSDFFDGYMKVETDLTRTVDFSGLVECSNDLGAACEFLVSHSLQVVLYNSLITSGRRDVAIRYVTISSLSTVPRAATSMSMMDSGHPLRSIAKT